LISISQLNSELKCTVTYNDIICVIQDHTSRSLIGVGEEKRGVFWFHEVDTLSTKANAVDAGTLWHQRLGHPSPQVISLLLDYLGVSDNYFNNKNRPCDICFRAKQT